MSSKGKPLFDLNEPAAEEDEESDEVFSFQPQRAIPSTTHTSYFFTASNSPRRIINNNAFSHAPSVSGFQPFIRPKVTQASEVNEDQKKEIVIEKEEGEWSDAEGSNIPEKSISVHDDKSQVKPMAVVVEPSSNVDDIKEEKADFDRKKDENVDLDRKKEENVDVDRKKEENVDLDRKSSGESANEAQEDSTLAPKIKDIKGAEAIHALKIANNPGKRPKLDHQKEAMLGKKRSRQTMFLNLEDVKQVGTIKTSTPRRQNFPPPITTRITKDKQIPPPITKEAKQVDQSNNESSSYVESTDLKPESNNGEMSSSSGLLPRPKRSISGTDLASEDKDKQISNHRQSVLKPTKNAQIPVRKTALISQNSIDAKAGSKKLPSKKPSTITNQYQDTSVERLLREVTNDKFWQHPGLKMFYKLNA